MSGAKNFREDSLKLRLPKPDDEISRRELFKSLLPQRQQKQPGRLELDEARCTGCGLCAGECLTGALVISAEAENAYQLRFKQEPCDGCGRCAEVCPEKCLLLETAPGLPVNAPAKVLFEDKLVLCRQCGKPVASRAMIEKLRAKLVGQSLAQLELCPECKTKSYFGLERSSRS